jgi:SAM-dependent methyltransferase
MIKGFVDGFSETALWGWAYDFDCNTPPLLYIAVNDGEIAGITPDQVREDLRAIGVNGPAGFRYRFRKPLGIGDLVSVTAGPGENLKGSPFVSGREYMRDFFLGRKDIRKALSYSFLEGAGIEIGALHNPLAVAPGVTVRYVDRMDVAGLRAQYPELESADLVDPDIIDDGETLGRVEEGTQDFVIANHFLEHTEDPIGCLKTFYRVLRPGGRLYLAVPDKTRTFDRLRQVTSMAHLEKDHLWGGRRSRKQHYRQWAAFINRKAGVEIHRHAESLEASRYSIHYHVWNHGAFMTFLGRVVQEHLPGFDILLCMRHDPDEIISVVEKKDN